MENMSENKKEKGVLILRREREMTVVVLKTKPRFQEFYKSKQPYSCYCKYVLNFFKNKS